MDANDSPEARLDLATQKRLKVTQACATLPTSTHDFSVRQWAVAQLNTLHAVNVLPTLPKADLFDTLRECGQTLKARGYSPKIVCLSWSEGILFHSLLEDESGPFAEITSLKPVTVRHQTAKNLEDDERAAWVVVHPQYMRATEMADLVQAVGRLANPKGHPIVLVPSETKGFRAADLGGWVHCAVNAVQKRMEAEHASLRLEDSLPAAQAPELSVRSKVPRM